MVSGGNSNEKQMEPHGGGPRCQAGEGAVLLREQVRGLGPGRVGQVRICVSEGEPGFWRVVVVVTTTEARAPAGQEEWV